MKLANKVNKNSMLYNVLLIVQIVVSVAIIVLVLMQQGKGADAGAAFGSGASGTVFGARGSANFLSRTTAILATVFFLNCIALAFLATGRTLPTASSIMDSALPAAKETAAPATPTTDVPAAPSAQTTSDVPAAPAVENKNAANGEKPVQDKQQ